ncbi:MAG: NAD(P)/FAD-dependent oxidoreductase [Burkholderiales bacterium]|nr:NAD(P)/FAD-dependent oxidoreductase [Burkholderiales bacterium]
MTEAVDTVVVGAGVVGLAVARALQQAGREVWLLERARAFGTETSARNSEVIHAGIYYPPGSLKARWCVRGKALLYEYCRRHGVPHRAIGKLIVATEPGDEPALHGYLQAARDNGVHDLEPLGAARLAQLEPAVRGTMALWSPSTGIIDSHAFMQALLADFERAGGQFVPGTAVRRGEVRPGGLQLELDDAERTQVAARAVVNSAGLLAPALAARIDGLPPDCVPRAHFAIGHYYGLAGRNPFRHLVYPVAEPGGLGVHVTLDLGGQVRFGPDVRWRDSIDYGFDDSQRPRFAAAIRRYFPALRDEALRPGFTGIRPKLEGPGRPAADFVLQHEGVHGVPGLVNLFGIESPGLTACLALAEAVVTHLVRAAW